jgi:isoquinoline 1-oxidoreductase
VDTSGAREIEGIQVIEEDDLIAVLHAVPDFAENALDKIKADYELPSTGLNNETIHSHLLNNPPPGETVAQGGDIGKGEGLADAIIENIYLDGYVAHAPIEPHTAVAKIEGERMTVWASTQTPFRLKEEAAGAIGLSPDKVRVITPFVGGGYGGKTANRQAVEAARLTHLTGKPVQVAWSRAEEFFLDTFRPAASVKIKAGVDASGMITSWDYGVYGAGQRGSEQFYDIPHHQTVVYGSGWMRSAGQHPLPTGAWRAPANNTNTFARESHIDVLAAKAGIDPIEFRMKNLADDRMLGVLQAAAKSFGWNPAGAPSGRGFGVACGIDAGTYVAHIAAVDVNRRTGEIQVKRVVCAQDMGLCVNPAGAEIQVEGCITMGLGYALAEEIQFADGQIRDTNFDSYQIPRFSWLPEIETVILDKRDAPPQGGGEPAIICMGAVIANAVFDATGARPLQMPMTPKRIREILSA